MEPTLHAGDRLLGRRSRRAFTRGEIVVIPHPYRGDFWLVKRVVGLPGERVAIEQGEVLVNGKPGSDLWSEGVTNPDGLWVLADDEIFVLSDNRRATRDDSRSFGPVPAATAYRVGGGTHRSTRAG